MSEFRRACEEVDDEIDSRAADLVRRGVPPWEAMERAGRSVREQRARSVKPESSVNRIIDSLLNK